MPDVNYTISSEAAKALMELGKVALEYKKIEGATKAVTNESDRSRRSFEKAAGAVGQIAAAAGGLSTVVSLINAGAQALERMAAGGAKTTASLAGTLAMTGELADLAQIRSQIEALNLPGVSYADRASLYGVVRGSIPAAERSRALAITEKAGQYADIAGMDAGRQFAAVMGEMGKLLPEMPAGALANLSTGLMREAGRYGGQFGSEAMKGIQQLMAEGSTPAEAIEIALASMEAGQGAKGLAGMAAYRISLRDAERLAAEQRAKGGKFRHAQAREVQIPAAVQAVMNQIGRRDYGAVIAGFQEADLYEQGLRGAMRDPKLAAQQQLQAAQEEVARAYEAGSEQALRIKAGREFLEYAMMEEGYGPFRRGIALGTEGIGPVKFGYAPWTSMGMDVGPAIRYSMPPRGRKEALAGWEAYEEAGGEISFEEALRRGRDQVRALEENTSAIKELSKLLFGGRFEPLANGPNLHTE